MASEESKVAFSTANFFQRWTGGNLGILSRSICSGLLGGWSCAIVFLFTKTDFSIFSDHAAFIILISVLYFLVIIVAPVLIVGLLLHSALVIARASSWIAYVISGAVAGSIAMVVLDHIVGLDDKIFEFRQMYSVEVCAAAGGFCALSFWLSLRPDRGPNPPKHRIYVTHRSRDIGE